VLILVDGDGIIVSCLPLFISLVAGKKNPPKKTEWLTNTDSSSSTLQFQETFIKQGIEGGKKAANALRTAIAEECNGFADNMEIVANVYANMEGLAKAMRRDGSIENETTLRDFALGFTQAKASFNFIDVGHGKERADAKVRGVSLPPPPPHTHPSP
jgi:hypothetical protein